MRRASPLSRRHLLALLAGGLVLPETVPRLQAQTAGDRGIGGTGAAPSTEASGDRGIGGTGFVGTIRRFGSIIVNDVRIAYPPRVPVTIDGRAASSRDLRLGQVVRVAAKPGTTGPVTSRIAVVHEVVGRIREIADGTMNVLNQRVDVSGLEPAPWWRPGAYVAVSGLRRPDGIIVASLVEPAKARRDRVTGTVEADDEGLWIDGLKLAGADPAWAGQRLVVTGRPTAAGFVVAHMAAEALPLEPGVTRLSLEAFLRREGAILRFGSGLAFADATGAVSISDQATARAVVEFMVDAQGGLSLTAIRVEGGGNGSEGGGGSGGGVAGPGGGGPGGPGAGGPGGGPGGSPGGAGPGGEGGGGGPGGGGRGGPGGGGGAGGGGSGGGGGGPR